MRRRDFLKGAVAMAGAGLGASLLREGRALAFGDVPSGGDGAMVPEALRAKSVLEIFLYGGVSQYESFYCVPEYGVADGTQWHSFLDGGEIAETAAECGFPADPLTEPFATDALGKLVHFGPNVAPLRARADVMQRVRVSVTSHDLEPHEGAIPLALAGRRLGHPALAGLGSHIQRYFLDRNDVPGRAPFSYVLLSSSASSLPTDNIRSATAVGMHPGSARPLSLKVDAAGDLLARLARGTVGEHIGPYDALTQAYVDRYKSRLTRGGSGGPLRSPRLTDLEAASLSIANAGSIAGVLDPALLVKIDGSACGDTSDQDAVAMSLRLATHLLRHPTSPARYACVIDAGLIPADGGGGYDTHFENPHTQARNLSHTLGALMALINEPGEGDPGKIDLDETMIVLTTEFGRTPYKQGERGRNHWPYGYPIVFLGGPIRAENHGVFGACGPDARATLSSSPQENRIAALLALGIWPFAPESYSVSDVPGASTEIEAATLVLERQLGLSS